MGDAFLRDIFDGLQGLKRQAIVNKKVGTPYLFDYYNVFGYYSGDLIRRKMAKIVNSAIEGLNDRQRLPRFIIVIIDKDIIEDVNMFGPNGETALREATIWVTRQIEMAVKRRRLEIIEKCPGAISGSDP